MYGEGVIKDTTALAIARVVCNRQCSKAGSIELCETVQHKLERKFTSIVYFGAGQFTLNPKVKGEVYKVRIQTASHEHCWRKCRVSCSFCAVLKLYFQLIFFRV